MKIYVSIPEGTNKSLMLTKSIRCRLMKIGSVDENKTDKQLKCEELAKKAQDYDIIISSWGCNQIHGKMLDGCRLKVIAQFGGTVRPCVDEEVFNHGVKVISGNSAFPPIIAESILYQMLTGLKRWHEADLCMKRNQDISADYYSRSLYKKKVGLIGYGRIAQYLVTLLKPFKVEIMTSDPYVTQNQADKMGFSIVSEEKLCKECDVISIQHTLNSSTYHLVDENLINLMKPNAIIVNMARGAVIDEQALIRRLKRGELFAALDVFEKEPLSKDSELRKLKNVFLTPHIGAQSYECRYALADAVVTQLEQYAIDGTLPNEVTKEMYLHMTDENMTQYKQ